MRIQREKDGAKLEELKMTLPFYIVKYLEHIGLNMTNTSALSYTYKIVDFLEWLIEYGHSTATSYQHVTLEELESLYTEDFDAYRTYLMSRPNSKYHGNKFYKSKNSNTTISNKMSALKSFFKFLSKTKVRGTNTTYLNQNVLMDYEVRVKADEEGAASRIKMNILQEEEMFEFIDFVLHEYGTLDLHPVALNMWNKNRERDGAIIALLLHSGLRVSELISIRIKDINLALNCVMVERKGADDNDTKPVYFSEYAAEILEDYMEIRQNRYAAENFENSPLFVTTTRGSYAKLISKNTVQKLVMKYATAYGKPYLTVHDLRHSFATYLLKETGNIRIVQETLGHSNIKTTQKYTHILNDEKRENIRQAFKKRANN
ncbi:tyrosine recombinase XerS [Bacillus sp. JJ722]|uniref:tyrosine recombinase XerS n=1 Tax=Bacillus sp. JJ722 TaxID=3122973 RepID=UPI002FFF8C7C